MTDTRIIRGFTVGVVNTRDDIDTEQVFRRMEGVLDLVDRYQPWRLRRLRQDIAFIIVQRFACRAAYFPGERACLLELTFMVKPDFSLSQIAASLVHEGVHARIHAMGVRVDPADKAREERLCRKAELELGRLVPDGAPVIERALGTMALTDEEVAPSVDWAEAERRVASADRDARR